MSTLRRVWIKLRDFLFHFVAWSTLAGLIAIMLVIAFSAATRLNERFGLHPSALVGFVVVVGVFIISFFVASKS